MGKAIAGKVKLQLVILSCKLMPSDKYVQHKSWTTGSHMRGKSVDHMHLFGLHQQECDQTTTLKPSKFCLQGGFTSGYKCNCFGGSGYVLNRFGNACLAKSETFHIEHDCSPLQLKVVARKVQWAQFLLLQRRSIPCKYFSPFEKC